MTAGKYCNREVIIAEADTTVVEAAQLMRSYHVGTLVVVSKKDDESMPLGIVTDRDLVIEVLAQQVSPEDLTVTDIMSRDLVMVHEKENLLDTLEIMRVRGVRRLPVINDKGGLEGILSADDALELINEATTHLIKLMRREVEREQKEHP
ncbi:MAG: CBS domain-containing protein [Gammaproteobacteria bacterium]|nr:MAG: CBS domain-containing protein [Gammaproteobacteria bacterium]